MLMTRDSPSIATNVNTITSSVIILLIGNVQMKHFCHRLVRKMDSGTVELFSMRTCPGSNQVSFEPVPEGLLVRAIFLNQKKSEDHQVTGSKARVG